MLPRTSDGINNNMVRTKLRASEAKEKVKVKAGA